VRGVFQALRNPAQSFTVHSVQDGPRMAPGHHAGVIIPRDAKDVSATVKVFSKALSPSTGLVPKNSSCRLAALRMRGLTCPAMARHVPINRFHWPRGAEGTAAVTLQIMEEAHRLVDFLEEHALRHSHDRGPMPSRNQSDPGHRSSDCPALPL